METMAVFKSCVRDIDFVWLFQLLETDHLHRWIPINNDVVSVWFKACVHCACVLLVCQFAVTVGLL